jgi:hypothetical protein
MTTAILGTWMLWAALAGSPAATVAEGIRQYHDGLLTESAATLQGAIVALSRDHAADRGTLVHAHVYRGAALVGLLQEEPAKAAFREALALQPDRRLQKGEFPDRVVRVFEAARKGKTESVLQRPPGTAQKAGHGAKVAWQVAGVTVLVGAASLLVDKLIETPEPSPSPSPRAGDAVRPSLAVPGGAARVLLNGSPAGALHNGHTVLSGVGGDVNHVEAVLTEGRGPGAWVFTFADGTLQPGSLAPLAGDVLQVGPRTIVFRSAGRPGERVAFRFQPAE